MKTITLANHKGGCTTTTNYPAFRQCFRCHLLKPLGEFARNRTYSLGHEYECKPCKSFRAKARYQQARVYVIIEEKPCTKCLKVQSASEFKRNRTSADGLTHLCRSCIRDNHARWRRATKQRILTELGGACACCGENTFEFLSIDHINGGGKKHREALDNDQARLYREILNEGCPRDKYRVLCHNCNQALGAYGFCPHQRKA